MSYFDLDPASDVNSVTNAALNPITPGDLGYGVVRGTLQGTGQGLLQGIVAQPAMIAADVFTPMLMPGAKKFDDYFGGTSAEDFLKSEHQKSAATVHALMPGPQIGTIGQIGYSLGSVVPQAVEGALIGGAIGGPVGAFAGMVTLPSAIQGYSAKRMGETYEGLDPTTATYKGLLEGGATAAGIALPGGFGAKTAISMAVGAATNVGVGMAQRYSTQQLLEARGYPEQAKQYETFDKTSIATDLILGLAFGGLHARGKAKEAARAGEPPAPTTPNIPPSVVDEALATNKQQHLEIDTAPGVPLDPQSRTVHGKAIDKAIQDVMADEPVDVSQTGIDSAEFVPNRAVMEAQVARAIEEEGSLRTTLDAVDELRAELESRGLAPADEALFAGERLQDAYDEVSASGARDLPGAVHGRDGEVFVGDRSEPVRFMVVDAGALKATMEKADNQYRDRSRTASQLQITKIANDLQFGRLGEAPTMAEGAPTLAQSGEIVGGNGRVAAIQQAYAGGKGDGYKLALEQRAAEFGLTPEAVRGMTEPVLVRQFTRPVDVKLAAILSNEGGALRMSALEQAKVDAERMPELAGVEMPESGDLTARSMDNFRKQWLSQYPQNELGEFVASDGKLSKQGEKRMVNAILFKAYGDSPALERMVESTDDLSKNLTNALLKSAQNVAEARDMIAVGDLHDLDIQPQLLQAFDTTQRLKAEGVKLDSYLAQNDMFGSGIGPEAVLWMEHFAKNTRSSKAISEAITGYYDAVRALGNPRQANIFDAQPPSRGEILRAVLKDEPVPVVKPAEAMLSISDAPQSLDAIKTAWTDAGIKHSISEKNGVISLSRIVVPDEARGTGAGTDAMQSLVDYADSTGQRIVLSPSTDFGASSKARLVKFYKRFGFVENKGRNKDYSTSEAMYREPEAKLSAADGIAKSADDGDTAIPLPEVSDADRQTITSLGDRILGAGIRGFELAPATRVIGAEHARSVQAATEVAERLFGKRVLTVEQPGTRLFNGLFLASEPNTIFLDARTDKPAMAVVGHELTHSLRNDRPDLYNGMLTDLREILTGKDEYAAEINAKREKVGMKPLDENVLTEEVLADVAGDQFMNPKFWSELKAQNESRFKALALATRDFLMDTLIKLDGIIAATGWRPFGSERLVSDLNRARRVVAKAFGEYSKGQTKAEAEITPAIKGEESELMEDGADISNAQTLDEQPNFRVVASEAYPTSAKLELERQDSYAAQAKRDAPGYDAAAACASR